ncbi:hypothetical protein C1I93_22030 [Micromonospora endophytica]|uniref:Uncharacterized protein n=1 Tax=Micromonospora endophytica TaxID=515350 RepID=A0A2W2D1A8_9ACTN|nr:hypothetical protein C1I93_22030 [Micromonospora endophytica]RIW50818.1 hypothetical protein D3H59_01500 [Micromonospora endophytica]BCJ58413.1 hypothetical protein Jiend_18350 [Micromonospora endophytica]
MANATSDATAPTRTPASTIWSGALRWDQREAFVVTQVLGLSYAKAAEACQCTISDIRSRIAPARNELVEALGDRQTPHHRGYRDTAG